MPNDDRAAIETTILNVINIVSNDYLLAVYDSSSPYYNDKPFGIALRKEILYRMRQGHRDASYPAPLRSAFLMTTE